MTCKEAVVELVECARPGDLCADRRIDAEPGRDLRAHLATCRTCNERWEAERQLTSHLAAIRNQTARLGSPAARRDVLMSDFARLRAPLPAPGTGMRYARWVLAAAAGLLFVIALGHQAGLRRRTPVAAVREGRGVRTEPAVLYESNALSSDASALSSDDFVAIPYTPPLAPGEMVRIVRADMYPEALAGMGVEIDLLAWSKAADVPVEMVVGEDGIPRAVRITDSNSF